MKKQVSKRRLLATELAVVEFQRRSGLVEDGIVARDTWAALRA